MSFLLSLASLALVTQASPAPATDGPAEAASETGKVEMRIVDRVPPGADKEAVIVCRSVGEAGSKIPRRLCRTKAEWEEIAAANQAALKESRRNGGNIPPPD